VQINAGIVSHVNLLLGDAAKGVLEAEIVAGNGRFRGIRHSSAWDHEPAVAGMYATRPKGLLLDPTFRKGFACLAPLNLSFDAWLFHPQIGELADLARAFPNTKIVLDHCGGPIGLGRFAGKREETFAVWKAAIRDVAKGGSYLSPRMLSQLVEDFRGRSKDGAPQPRFSTLTPRERQVLKMLAEGGSVKEIATELVLSVKTVEAHKFNLMHKLDIHNKAQLVQYAFQKKIVQIPGITVTSTVHPSDRLENAS